MIGRYTSRQLVAGVGLAVGDAVWTMVLGQEWAGFATVVRLMAIHYGLLFVFGSVQSVFLRDGKMILLINGIAPVIGAVLAFGVLPRYGFGFHAAILTHVAVAATVTAAALVQLVVRQREMRAHGNGCEP